MYELKEIKQKERDLRLGFVFLVASEIGNSGSFKLERFIVLNLEYKQDYFTLYTITVADNILKYANKPIDYIEQGWLEDVTRYLNKIPNNAFILCDSNNPTGLKSFVKEFSSKIDEIKTNFVDKSVCAALKKDFDDAIAFCANSPSLKIQPYKSPFA